MGKSVPDKLKFYVGIDQSYSSTGVVVLGSDGSCVAKAFKAGKPEHPFHERLNDLWKQIARILPNPKDTLICMEGAAYAAEFNVFMLGELSGALKYCMYNAGYKYDIVQPTVLKKFATGAGNAQKAAVAVGVRTKWGFENKSNDIIDAFVLAKVSEAGGNNAVAQILRDEAEKAKIQKKLKARKTKNG